MPRIDSHAHFAPKDYLERVQKRAGGKLPIPPWELEVSLEMMARHAIDASIISISPPGVFMGDQGEANELARVVNQAGAEIIRSRPAQFAALACLPLPDLDAAMSELEYALDVLKLDGVAVFTHTGQSYLGDPKFAPLLEELNRREAYVFVHPALPVHATPLTQYPTWLYEFPFETTRCIVDLIYSGTLERNPNIRFQFAHQGGTIPFLAGRIASLPARSPKEAGFADRAPKGALEYLRHLYYDTGLSNNAAAIVATLEITSFDHLVFGTDFPYADLPASGDPAPQLEFLKERRSNLEYSNNAALVPRLFAALEAQKENA
jgi:predicted TIM-barrel fold metal-dependent hydrolase